MTLDDHLAWWQDLRHEGLFLDVTRLRELIGEDPPPLPSFQESKLRRAVTMLEGGEDDNVGAFVSLVLEHICGFTDANGKWQRGSNIPTDWSRHSPTGESLRPRHLWTGPRGAVLPIFIDTSSARVGIGRGRRTLSQVLQWLRAGHERLALLTNGRQWRLIFTGLDFHASVEWDIASWLEEGAPSRQLIGLRSLLNAKLWTPAEPEQSPTLLKAILDSRKGQSDLSAILGERVRRAVEILAQAHEQILHDKAADIDNADIYRASVRTIMRLVVILFAEARELLPADNEIYHSSYGVRGLRDQLDRDHIRSPARLARSYSAWPRLLALFHLIHDGCSHESLPMPQYGGELFESGDSDSTDPISSTIHLFETASFNDEVMSDREVREILNLLTRTKARIRQGRGSTLVPMPVNFAELDNEYIGILYEGLLDYELRAAPDDQPVVFLNVGDQPALPLATLEAMDDKALKSLLEKMKERSSSSKSDEDEGEEDELDEEEADDGADESEGNVESDDDAAGEDEEEEESEGVRHTTRTRAETWARRACEVAGLVRQPRSKQTPEKRRQYDDDLGRAARKLVDRVILPREWYLVRWGGTRKGSGTFYTKPQLAIPTVHRTLRPLAYDPPTNKDGEPDRDAPAHKWTPKKPEDILAVKVCDPACGSGSFLLAALRFLTDAVYESVVVHKRLEGEPGRPLYEILGLPAPVASQEHERIGDEKLPCPPDQEGFEERFKAVLRRHVVERCVYGVDLDPLAAELCRQALWIETMDRELPFSFLDHKIRPGNSLVGAWFDQFQHYPVMAWEREGGDKSHTNGVHFKKEAITKAIRQRRSKEVKPDLIDFIESSEHLFRFDLENVSTIHDEAEQALNALHELPVHESAERARRYAELRKSESFQRLMNAFDLWCAMWFWPGGAIEFAPLPTEFAEPSDEVKSIVAQVAAEKRFFHWELEFPDVFNKHREGFDAIVGNPPWEIAKPNSREFFSNLDPLYRAYGKQDAIREQTRWFELDERHERDWIEYNAGFRAMSNWVKCAGFPFGDRVTTNSQGKHSHDFPIGDRGRASFDSSKARHAKWKENREQSTGYADAAHSFRHQGGGDINLYKTMLEQAHALLGDGGRLGMIVPSGLYSDHGTGPLRELFIDHCQWQWLFGFENREKVFDIDSRFKFNPVIVEKGGVTEAIHTAFMRRNLNDWETGERFATPYTREQVTQFSPKSRALLEIQSQRDLQILEKIYSNSVLLGDQGPDGWGIKYATEFHMTNDSKLFPPRPKWEEWGYRPDEYSRWIKGPWRPIEELWNELGVDSSKPEPIDEVCARQIEQGIASGEIAKTDWREWGRRCAQPPYDTLPIPRAEIPEGIFLSRAADAWIREDEIPEESFTDASGKALKIKVENEDGVKEEIEITGRAIALPLNQGIMIHHFNTSIKYHVRGTGLGAHWESTRRSNDDLGPQYLIAEASCLYSVDLSRPKYSYRRIARNTEVRTMIGCVTSGVPAGDSVFHLVPSRGATDSFLTARAIESIISSLTYDWQLRARLGATNLNWSVVNETALVSPTARVVESMVATAWSMGSTSARHSIEWARRLSRTGETASPWRLQWTLIPGERLRKRALMDAVIAVLYGLVHTDLYWLISDCDHPHEHASSKGFTRSLDQKGFWRVDKDKHPEHRHTVLTFIAFHDLRSKIDACGGDRENGIKAFLNQNDGEGWMLPETLRLADYGLGHDDRAKEHQPVRSVFGPRFYDWQLAQTAEESWRECELHARNLLGPEGFAKLKAELEGRTDADKTETVDEDPEHTNQRTGTLFSTKDAPLFEE